MYKIIFYKNHENLFNNFTSKTLNKLKQIVIETNLPAFIIDCNSGEIVFEK